MLKEFEQLAALHGPSGREGRVAHWIRERWGQSHSVREDRIGNLHVTFGQVSAPHIAISSHMDEVGLIVRTVRPDGFVGVNKIGGIPERALVGQTVSFITDRGIVDGVCTTWSHHTTPDDARYIVRKVTDIWVDIGAQSRESARIAGVREGVFGVYARSWRTTHGRVFCNAIDNRMAIALQTALLDQPAPHFKLSLVASVQEEFSVRSLLPTIRTLNPDVLILLDICPADDTPEYAGETTVRLDGGPVLYLHSFHSRGTLGGVLCPKWLESEVEAAAEAVQISIQRASRPGIITDGAFVQHLNDGIPVVELGLPTRYTHGPVEVCSIADLQALSALVIALTERLSKPGTIPFLQEITAGKTATSTHSGIRSDGRFFCPG